MFHQAETYSTEWAKQKIQEIKGTVKVEGIVDVQGTVKIDSSANKEALLQRGMMALEEGQWNTAKKFFDQALNYDATYADAYLGLAMAETNRCNIDAFFEMYVEPTYDYCDNQNVLYAKKYGDQAMKDKFKDADQKREKIIKISKDKKIQDRAGFVEIIRERERAKKLLYHDWDGIIGLCTDGNVVVCKPFHAPAKIISKFDIASWRDIISVSIGDYHILGLRADGTVLAQGDNSYGQCNVESWRSIKAIATGHDYSVGLRADGTVVATGNNGRRCCDVSSWENIVQVICISGEDVYHTWYGITIGLKSDGTIVKSEDSIASHNEYNQVLKWKKIVSIREEYGVVIGESIEPDGTTVFHYCDFHNDRLQPDDGTFKTYEGVSLLTDMSIAVGPLQYDSALAKWKDVIDICGFNHIICGLHLDGTVSTYITDYENLYAPKAEQIEKWEHIIAIYNIGSEFYGLQEDGRIVTTYQERIAALSHWKLFDNYRTIESERKAALERAAIEKRTRIEELTNERNVLQTELSNLSGLFSGKRRKEIQSRLSEIDAELNKLK